MSLLTLSSLNPFRRLKKSLFVKLVAESLIRFKWNYIWGTLCIVVINALDTLPAIALKNITDAFKGSNPLYFSIPIYASLFIGVYIILGILRFAWRYYFNVTARKIQADMRHDLLRRVLHSSYSSTSKLKIGDTISLLGQDTNTFRAFIGPGILVLVDMTTYFLYIPSILFWTLGWNALWIITPLLIIPVYMYLYDKRIIPAYEKSSEVLGKISDHIHETSVGVKVFRVLNLFGMRHLRYQGLLGNLYKQNYRLAKYDSLLETGLDFQIFFCQMILFFLCVLAFTKRVEGLEVFAVVGTVVLVVQLMGKLVWPLMAVSYLATMFERARAAVSRLRPLYELKESPQGTIRMSGPPSTVELKDISFAYPGEKNKVLSDINFKLKSGEKIGLVGDVGSGKSTLLKILATLYSSDEIQNIQGLLINEIPFADLHLDHYRNNLSYIPQEAVIFNTSIASNIAPELRPDKERILESIRKASLESDIAVFPNGIETQIGEKGINLSGGQKQRIAIARSFYSAPSIYLWDDVISALDIRTERAVISSIFEINPQSMLVLATHRTSALMNFDRIYVFENGKIIEEGNFDHLIHSKGKFHDLFEYERKASAQGVPT